MDRLLAHVERAVGVMSTYDTSVIYNVACSHVRIPDMSSMNISMPTGKRGREDDTLEAFRAELKALMDGPHEKRRMDGPHEKRRMDGHHEKRWEHIARLMSNHVEAVTKSKCKTQLVISYDETSVPRLECTAPDFTGNESEEALTFTADAYISLNTRTGCTLCVMGMGTTDERGLEYKDRIELYTDTVHSQKKKGYSRIMIAAAAIVTFIERKYIYASIANPVSAYTLLQDYAGTFTIIDNDKIVEVPFITMSKTDAERVKKDIISIRIPCNADNFDRCTRIFIENTLRCAEDIDTEGSESNPITV